MATISSLPARSTHGSSDWLRPVIVIPLGAVFTLAGGSLAFFVTAFLPLGFYGDEDVPAGFESAYTSYFHTSTVVVAVTAIVLLLASAVLASRKGRPLRVACTATVLAAVATPVVWLIVTYALTEHWYHTFQ